MNKEKNKNAEFNKLKENLPVKLLHVKHLLNDSRNNNKLILDFDNNQKQISLMGTISLDEVNVLINSLTHLRNNYLV